MLLDALIKILLVENNLVDVRFLQELGGAAEFPFEIVHSETLASALEVLANGGPDVVLLDLGCPMLGDRMRYGVFAMLRRIYLWWY